MISSIKAFHGWTWAGCLIAALAPGAAAQSVTFYTNLSSFQSAVSNGSSFYLDSANSNGTGGATNYATSAGLTINNYKFTGSINGSGYWLSVEGPNFYGNDYTRIAPHSSLQAPAVSSAFYSFTNGSLVITMPAGGVTAFGLELWDVQTGDTSGIGTDTVKLTVNGKTGSVVTPEPTGEAFIGFTSTTPIASVTLTGTDPEEFPQIGEVFTGSLAAIPTITQVLNAFSPSATIAPNTWVRILGSTLDPAGDARAWQASDFVNNQMPTELDGVSATVNGKNAYVEYISSAQVNILTPPDAISGPVNVVLTNMITSVSFSAQAAAISPSFFVFSDQTHVVAQHLNYLDVGPPSLYPGLTSPAAPGEEVVLYANGFGQTSVPVVSGSTTQGGALPTLPVVMIGSLQATVLYAGLAGPGLFQFNVIIPQGTPSGDIPLTATYGGLTTQSGVVISVQN